MEAVREVLGNVARGVQRSMHEKLKRGDASELLEHWRYYMEREGGRECFTLAETEDGGAVFEVRRVQRVTISSSVASKAAKDSAN